MHEFVLPSFKLGPQEYLILCQDSVAFRKQFPEVKNILGNFDFGISKKREYLNLYTNDGASIDSVGYNLEPLDTIFSLALLLPSLNNQNPENWEVIPGVGTPNFANPYYLESRIRAEQGWWVKTGIALGLLLCSFLVLHMRRNYLKGQNLLQVVDNPTSQPTLAPLQRGVETVIWEKPSPPSTENENEI